MSKVIIVGHGGYGTAIGNCLRMLLGETPGMYYVDFNEEDNLEALKNKLNSVLKECHEEEVLFACDLAGGSPFRECAMLCTQNPGFITVAGLNIAAYAEMVYGLEQPVKELAKNAIDTARAAVLSFPDNL